MGMTRLLFILVNLVATGMVVSSCAMKGLKDNLDSARQEYGYFKGRVTVAEEDSPVLVGLFELQQGDMTLTNVRTVVPGETFYVLVTKGAYNLLAFSDSNGDFAYQAGESAIVVDDPIINWFSDLQIQERIDHEALRIQQIELTNTAVLEQELDFSLAALREESKAAENFLRVVSWDDEIFSTANATRGLWEPVRFQEEIGFGLYVLKHFDPTKKSILFVHGIDDAPRVFETMARAIPADYQLLLFQYPSGFPLEHTSYALSEALDELLRRYPVPQLDVIAHSMGGLVSKGMLSQVDEIVRQRVRLFISIASPFGGQAAAAIGTRWSPVVAPVWWAMAPDSTYLQAIDELDLSSGPTHHLIFTFSHETGGKSEGDDGVVTVKSQLTGSAQRNATAIYGIADNHKGVTRNPCTSALVSAILQDGNTRVTIPGC
jgi:pimeloyl-ACP methyl ester carboxylesterase